MGGGETGAVGEAEAEAECERSSVHVPTCVGVIQYAVVHSYIRYCSKGKFRKLFQNKQAGNTKPCGEVKLQTRVWPGCRAWARGD